MIIRKSAHEIEKMAAAGALVAETIAVVGEHIRPGVTTAELDRIGEEHIASRGGVPTSKGYRGFPGFMSDTHSPRFVHRQALAILPPLRAGIERRLHASQRRLRRTRTAPARRRDMIRILIADDQELVRTGFRVVLGRSVHHDRRAQGDDPSKSHIKAWHRSLHHTKRIFEE